MGIPFDEGCLSPLDGELFVSHKKKLAEMDENWSEYPFKKYRLKVKSKKSYIFRKAYVTCSCGRKGNLSCVNEMCCKCCLKESNDCTSHKTKIQ